MSIVGRVERGVERQRGVRGECGEWWEIGWLYYGYNSYIDGLILA